MRMEDWENLASRLAQIFILRSSLRYWSDYEIYMQEIKKYQESFFTYVPRIANQDGVIKERLSKEKRMHIRMLHCG